MTQTSDQTVNVEQGAVFTDIAFVRCVINVVGVVTLASFVRCTWTDCTFTHDGQPRADLREAFN